MLDEQFVIDGGDHPTEHSVLIIKESQTFDGNKFDEKEESKIIEKIQEDVKKDSTEVSTLKERLQNAEKTLKDHQDLLKKK